MAAGGVQKLPGHAVIGGFADQFDVVEQQHLPGDIAAGHGRSDPVGAGVLHGQRDGRHRVQMALLGLQGLLPGFGFSQQVLLAAIGQHEFRQRL